MDPLAHTLFGAALAETGLRRRTRYATSTLVIGANLPDIDIAARLWGHDAELHFRRGLTHGVLALVVLPLLLAAAVGLWHRWRGDTRAGAADAPPYRPGAVVALAFLAVVSHPLLDALNTYGVRLLMPFDGRWFYGDTLFIVDPWFWLLAAAGVFLARSATRLAVAGWLVLAALASGAVLGTGLAPPAVKAGWVAGLALLAALRWRRPAVAAARSLTRAGLALLALHVGVAYGLARRAESATAQRQPDARQVQANPVPGTPWAHRLIVVADDAYRVVLPDGTVHELPRRPPDAVVRAALASESIKGFVNWMRFPDWSVEEAPGHWIVRIRDLRYQGPGVPRTTAIGLAQVEVPREDAPAPPGGSR